MRVLFASNALQQEFKQVGEHLASIEPQFQFIYGTVFAQSTTN